VASHQTLKKDEFYALLSVADLAVITPLRDGMNTTSMEFVIAQEKTKKSPLVLSEFMGISKHMEDALQVNPWNLVVSGISQQRASLIDGSLGRGGSDQSGLVDARSGETRPSSEVAQGRRDPYLAHLGSRPGQDVTGAGQRTEYGPQDALHPERSFAGEIQERAQEVVFV
jgi:hypothetical protein